MASSVFYKFRSQKDESRITFNGTGISVFDLKREIILANNLGKANDFDLFIYDAGTNQEYTDDSQTIQRSSSVIVKRLPASRPGKGKAAMYIANASNNMPVSDSSNARPSSGLSGNSHNWHKGAMSKRFDNREEPAPSKSSTPAPAIPKTNITADDEAAAMAAMFQAQTASWEEAQEKMSHAVRVYSNTRGTGFSRGGKPSTFQSHYSSSQSDKPLPSSYVCYRCGQKGHWIKDCPTNNDREFDNKPRIKRTTGIPRSMLKAVENPDGGQLGQGVMVTPEGGYVVAQPDSASWQKQVTRQRGITAAEVKEKTPTDSKLACPIDNKLFRDAVKTPCCGKTYCEECIQTHLLERDFVCPSCGKKVASLDKLIVDKPTRTKVADYIDKAVEDSKKYGSEDGTTTTPASNAADGQLSLDQDLYSEQQPGSEMEMSQMIVDSIPQLQAQINQISVMLQNTNLPNQVRHTTEMQYQQLQMQLQQAQAMSVALAAATSFQQQQQQQQKQQQAQLQQQQQQQHHQMQHGYQKAWTNPYANQAPGGIDSAYQRLPINNRRRNLKRERPSDFLEVGGEREDKTPRYWE